MTYDSPDHEYQRWIGSLAATRGTGGAVAQARTVTTGRYREGADEDQVLTIPVPPVRTGTSASRFEATDPGGLPPQVSSRAATTALHRPARGRTEHLRPVAPSSRRRRRSRPRASRVTSWRDDMVAGVLSMALALGLALDGWNHLNLLGDTLGPFLTPWHFLLYAGFTSTALWGLTRGQRLGSWSFHAVPRGYRVVVAGTVLGFVALGGDAVWHTFFGEEQGVARLISPFHLVLGLASCLLASAAFRSMWLARTTSRTVGLRELAPALCSATAVASVVAFFLQFSSPLVAWGRPAAGDFPNGSPGSELLQIDGVVGILLTTLVLVAPVLLLLRRWQPPFGAVTLMFSALALLAGGLTNLSQGVAVGTVLFAGLAGDLMIRWQRPTPDRPLTHHLVAAVIPSALWTSYFLCCAVLGERSGGPTIPVGTIGLATLAGYALSVLMNPPSAPHPPRACVRGCRGRTATASSGRALDEFLRLG